MSTVLVCAFVIAASVLLMVASIGYAVASVLERLTEIRDELRKLRTGEEGMERLWFG